MTNAIQWDDGSAWDSPGLTWGGVVPEPITKKKTSMNTKAIIDFSGYGSPELSPVAQHIHDQITANAATFPSLPFTMVIFQGWIDSYDALLVARESKATADILAFNVARADLEGNLGTLGNYVNSVANGDASIVEKSGFPSYTTGGAPDTAPPAAPTDLRLRHGELSGTVVARYKPVRTPSTNEIHVSTGDPNDPASWTPAGIFQNGKAILTGLTPGAVVWVRVRTVGLRGVMGAWSDPAQIRVL
jgi:hypothetical protein